MKKLTWIFTGTALAALATVVACTAEQAKAKPNFVTKDPPAPGVVAKINGQNITEEDLIGDAKMDFHELKKREFDLKMDRLNKLVVDRMIGDEAKKAGMPLDAYIDKNVVKGEIKISDTEYQKFVAEKRIPKEQINPQIKDRINNFLKSQKRQDAINGYIAKITKSNPVEVYFSKPKMEVAVDTTGAPQWGKDDAPVTLVEFSDFQCPFCSRGAETVIELKKKYGEKKLKVVFMQFPLPMHQNALPAAELSECIRDQGVDKFWKFHDIAFKNQDKLDGPSLLKYAKQSGADDKKVDACFKAGTHKDAVKKSMEYGEKIGVRSTPTFFVNGQMVAGALPVDSFSEMIDEEIEAKKK